MHPTLRHPRRLLLVALGLGLCADYLFYGRWLGIGVPLFVALSLAALYWLGRVEDRPPQRANLWLGAAAIFFALCIALRDAPFLLVLNLLAVLGLLLLFAAHYRGAALARLPGGRVLTQLLVATAEISVRPVPLAFQSLGAMRITTERAHRLLPIGRGLLLAAPVVLVFTGLLMAADSVFSSYVLQVFSLELPFDPSALLAHAMITGIVAWLYAGGALTALRRGGPPSPFDAATAQANRILDALFGAPQPATVLPAEGDTQPLPTLRRPLLAIGCVEALTVLIAVDVLFGGFIVVQAAYFFGGLDTLARSGMTYAEYARRGFFELVAVACLALALLWLLALLARRDSPWQRRAFNMASALLILLVLGLLASAFQRMSLYEQAYGYTRLRLYTHSFMIWLALVLGLFLLALLRERPRLFSSGSFIAALLYLATLNVANPDALIVRENIARYQAGGDLDLRYLFQLSADAAPALAAAATQLPPVERDGVVGFLGNQRAKLAAALDAQGWPAWSLARARVLEIGD